MPVTCPGHQRRTAPYSTELISSALCGRDVKLENALLDSTHTLLKITDFGYAKTSADSNCLSLVGTPGYAAPEVVSAVRQQYDGRKADMWSCGVMLYVMLFHSAPPLLMTALGLMLALAVTAYS